MNDDATDEKTLQEQCIQAANMAVDALLMAGILDSDNANRACEIIAEEILVRKAMQKL